MGIRVDDLPVLFPGFVSCFFYRLLEARVSLGGVKREWDGGGKGSGMGAEGHALGLGCC